MKTKDAILENVMNGQPISDLVIDCHTHYDGFPFYSLIAKPYEKQLVFHQNAFEWIFYHPGLRELIRCMDSLGIGKICMFAEPDVCIKSVKKYPGRFLPFITAPGRDILNDITLGVYGMLRKPPASTPDEIEQELQRDYDLGFRGIKLWWSKVRTPHIPQYARLLEFSNKHKFVIVNHNWIDYKILSEIASSYPNIAFIMGHGLMFDKEAVPVLQERENVFQSTTNLCVRESLEMYVKNVGADKLVFGSDALLHSFAFTLGNIAYAKISYKDKCKILGLNMKKIILDRGHWETWGFHQESTSQQK